MNGIVEIKQRGGRKPKKVVHRLVALNGHIAPLCLKRLPTRNLWQAVMLVPDCPKCLRMME